MDETPETTGSSMKGQAREDLRDIKSKAAQAAQGLKESGVQQLQQTLESRKSTAAEQVEHLADAVNRASDELHQHQQDTLADYASQLAGGITRFADNLRSRNINDLISDTQALAQRNPTLFFIGSIGVGIALSRFLKASSERQQLQAAGDWSGGDNYDVSYGSGSEWERRSQSTTSEYGTPAYGAGGSQVGYGDDPSQSEYAGQTTGSQSSNWSARTGGDGDFEVREGRNSQVDDFAGGTDAARNSGSASTDARRDL